MQLEEAASFARKVGWLSQQPASFQDRFLEFAELRHYRPDSEVYRLGEEAYRDRLMLAWARAGGGDAASWRPMADLPLRWSAPKFPLKAADFISRGIAEGPALGHVLAIAEDAWLAAGFPLEPAALDGIADQTVARFARDHRL